MSETASSLGSALPQDRFANMVSNLLIDKARAPQRLLCTELAPEDLQDAEKLETALTLIEPYTRLNGEFAYERALELRRAAVSFDNERLQMRASLVIADVQIRRGQSTTGLRAAEAIERWARTHEDFYVCARANRVLASFSWRLGDHPKSLEYAYAGVELLPADTDQMVLAEHRLAVADTLVCTGSYQSAREEYLESIELSRRCGSVQMQLVGLNNLACLHYERGDTHEALTAVSSVIALCAEHNEGMQVAWVDTVSRIKMELGQYHEVFRILASVVRDRLDYPQEDQLGVAECMITYAEAARKVGEVDEAEAALDMCDDMVGQLSLELLRSELIRARASLAAHRGDHRRAFELEREAYKAAADKRTDERDARARSMLVQYQNTEAMADRAHFKRLSVLDSLTGLGNRRYVNETINTKRRWAKEHNMPLAVGLVDLDHFKRVNDTWSHDVGDRVLQEVAAVLARLVGMQVALGGIVRDQETPWKIDIDHALQDPALPYAARLGGEEFILVMPGVDSTQALETCQTVLDGVRDKKWSEDVPVERITGSLGLVVTDGTASMSDILRQADVLLYQAKEAGRDQIAGPTLMVG